jgi:hypothetical protein
MRSLGRIFLIAVLSAVLGGCVGSYGNGRYNLYDGYNAYGRPNNIANGASLPSIATAKLTTEADCPAALAGSVGGISDGACSRRISVPGPAPRN